MGALLQVLFRLAEWFVRMFLFRKFFARTPRTPVEPEARVVHRASSREGISYLKEICMKSTDPSVEKFYRLIEPPNEPLAASSPGNSLPRDALAALAATRAAALEAARNMDLSGLREILEIGLPAAIRIAQEGSSGTEPERSRSDIEADEPGES